MKSFFSNVWVKRFVSVIAAFYTVGVCFLSYFSVFYSIHVDDGLSVCLLVSAISVIALILMLYTREQLVTKISSFVILTAMLPVVVLYFGEKEIIIPVIVTGILILLFSGAGEGMKTVIGTVILLLYVFSALGYFVFVSFFVTTAKEEVIDSGFSPSGRYRYSIVNTEDTSGGSTSVYIEPNYADVSIPFATFKLKNMSRTVYQTRPVCETVTLDWDSRRREDITAELNKLSKDIKVSLSLDELGTLGYNVENTFQLSNINVYYLINAGLTASDVNPVKLDDFTPEQLALFDIGRDSVGRYYMLNPTEQIIKKLKKNATDRVYLSEFNSRCIKLFNQAHTDIYGNYLFELGKDNTVPLGSLTDEQLAQFGVSEEGDILTFNDKICFRYYVAEIEDYFDVDSRKLSLDLLNPAS